MEAIGVVEMERLEREDLEGRSPAILVDKKYLFWEKLKLPVLKHEKTGNPTFNKAAMLEYEHLLNISAQDSTLARKVLEWRGWEKAVTSYYRPYQHKVSSDGRIRCNYKLHGTKTGRWSSADPNLQQIPKVTDKPWNGSLKSCFIPETGYELWEFDYSQLELRLATAFAKIPSLLEIFADPTRDIFTEMSQQLEMTRPDTKTLVYAIQYGAGATHLSKVFRVSFAVAKERVENFYRAYPQFRILSQQASSIALRNGKLKLWSGRYRHFTSPSKEAHKAFNSFIQGGAADVVERQMVRLDAEGLNNEECRLLLQIHDSVVFEIKSDAVERYKPRIIQILEDVRPDFGVVFRVDAHHFGGE
jgi:DNA polymerase-1